MGQHIITRLTQESSPLYSGSRHHVGSEHGLPRICAILRWVSFQRDSSMARIPRRVGRPRGCLNGDNTPQMGAITAMANSVQYGDVADDIIRNGLLLGGTGQQSAELPSGNCSEGSGI